MLGLIDSSIYNNGIQLIRYYTCISTKISTGTDKSDLATTTRIGYNSYVDTISQQCEWNR
jgi:hypothetical protein